MKQQYRNCWFSFLEHFENTYKIRHVITIVHDEKYRLLIAIPAIIHTIASLIFLNFY